MIVSQILNSFRWTDESIMYKFIHFYTASAAVWYSPPEPSGWGEKELYIGDCLELEKKV